ncbi:MAG: MBG domain-containing protein, partial [Victivallales bacterium]
MNFKRFMMVMCLGIFMMPIFLNAKTVYVKSDASGGNSGTSWANAYTDLQNAINNASSGDQIWVAAGTYKPTTGTDRAMSFQMKDGVNIYGGFSGTEISSDQRKWMTNETILNGDINVQGDNTDNTYHVVVAANNSTLDGFIVEKGYAISPTPLMLGAGILIVSKDSTIIRNCQIRQNTAIGPGGANGAGIFIDSSSGILIEDCIINQNSTSWEGGGIYSSNSNPTIRRCSFIGNSANLNGGGFKCDSSGSPVIQNCIFASNTTPGNGGGVYIEMVSVTLENCVFYENSKTAVFHVLTGTTTLKNSIVWGNSGTQISGSTTISYSNIQGGFSGTGNINSDPLFADPSANDFHLKSQYGRWSGTSWVYDTQTSPCIDTGDTGGTFINEPVPSGSRINMGAYGNTVQASKSSFVVTFIAEANGFLTGNVSQEVKYGNACSTVEAVPNTGYHFVNWTGDMVSTVNPLTVSNVTSNIAITANFAKNDIVSALVLYYPLDGNVNDQSEYGNNGTITGATLTSDRFGNTDNAYYFDNGDTDELVFGNYTRPSNNFSFGAWVKVDKTITIRTEATSGIYYDGQNYVFDPPQEGANAGAGLSVGTNGIQVFEHGSLYLTCLASYSESIGTGWNHVLVVYNNKQPTIYLNGVAVKTGLTSVRPNVFAPKITGYFTVDCYGPYNGSIDEIRIYNRVLSSPEAMDLYNTPSITASAGMNGTISPSGTVAVVYESNKTFTISPLANYHVSDVLVDGTSVGAVTEYTFTNVKISHTIVATFARNTATLTVNRNGNGTVVFTGANPVNTSTAIPISAAADANNHFVNWTVSSGSATIENASSAETTVTLNGSHDSVVILTANFLTGKAVATVTISDLNQTYTKAKCPVTITTVPVGLNVNITYAGVAVAPSNAGSYSVKATVVHDNYAGVKTGTLVIAKANQTINFPSLPLHVMGDADFSPNATANSDLPVTYTSSNPAVATIVGGKLHIIGKGSSLITAKQAGNANWNAAPPIPQTLNVAMGDQIITFNDIPNKVYGNTNFAPGATASSGLATTYTSSNLSVATIVSGKIHITGVGATTITALQIGNANWNAANTVTQKLTVGQGTPVITWANPVVITYGTLLSATQLNARANVPGKFTYAPALGSKLTAGPQTLAVDFVPTDSSRYNNIHKEVTLTVKAATATLTIAGLSQKYAGTARPVAVTTLPKDLKVDITYNGNADAPSDVGSYTVLATVNDPNGTGSKTGTLVIAKASQTIAFAKLPSMGIGDDDNPLTAKASSGLPVSYSSSNPAVATIVNGAIHLTGTGTAIITATQTGDSNWNAATAVRQTQTVLIEGVISDFYAEMKGMLESHDQTGFFSLFSPDYIHHGKNLADEFSESDLSVVKTFTYNITRIEIAGDDAKVYGSFTISYNNGNPSETWSEPDTTDNSVGVGWLRKGQADWEVIGDQMLAEVNVTTVHDARSIYDHYFFRMHTVSPFEITGVSVSGSKIDTFELQPDLGWEGFTGFTGDFTAQR